nr:hypothetical protein [Tanacetum cinerariifolium]
MDSQFLVASVKAHYEHAQPEDTNELLQKLLEDLQIISEELAEYINSPSWNRPTFYNNDEEHSFQYKEYLENSSNVITTVLPTKEPEYSLSMGDEHLSTIPDDELLSKEDVPMENFKIFSNPLFDDEEINSNKIDPHYFNAESNLIESLSNQDTLFDSNSKFDYLEEFSGELIPTSIINEERIKREHEEYISLIEKLLTINSVPCPLENFHANTIIETLPTSPILVEDSDSLSNDSISLPKNESSNFDHHDDPSFPRPPLKPPDVVIFFEPDSGVLTTNVVKGISEHYVLMPNILPTLPTFDPLYPVYDTLLLFSSENKDKVFKLDFSAMFEDSRVWCFVPVHSSFISFACH